MIWWRTATVTSIDRVRVDAVEGRATLDRPVAERSSVRVLAYPAVTGPLAVGDVVWVTVTALALELGTGGYALVAAPSSALADPSGPGHLVKSRYSPLQVAVQGADEQGSPHHDEYDEGTNDQLWEVVQTLPPKARSVVVLRYYEQMSEAEVADALGISIGTGDGHARDRDRDPSFQHDDASLSSPADTISSFRYQSSDPDAGPAVGALAPPPPPAAPRILAAATSRTT